MKCPMCGGDGITDKFTPNVGRCIKCNGSGEIEPTNEEWLHSLNTEQLAECISDITCNCWGCKRIYVEDCPNYARYKACFCDKEDVLEWLKQPHSEVRK